MIRNVYAGFSHELDNYKERLDSFRLEVIHTIEEDEFLRFNEYIIKTHEMLKFMKQTQMYQQYLNHKEDHEACSEMVNNRYKNDVEKIKRIYSKKVIEYRNLIIEEADKDLQRKLKIEKDKIQLERQQIEDDLKGLVKAKEEELVKQKVDFDQQLKNQLKIQQDNFTKQKTDLENQLKVAKDSLAKQKTDLENQLKTQKTDLENQLKVAKDASAKLKTDLENQLKTQQDNFTKQKTSLENQLKAEKDASVKQKADSEKVLSKSKEESKNQLQAEKDNSSKLKTELEKKLKDQSDAFANEKKGLNDALTSEKQTLGTQIKGLTTQINTLKSQSTQKDDTIAKQKEDIVYLKFSHEYPHNNEKKDRFEIDFNTPEGTQRFNDYSKYKLPELVKISLSKVSPESFNAFVQNGFPDKVKLLSLNKQNDAETTDSTPILNSLQACLPKVTGEVSLYNFKFTSPQFLAIMKACANIGQLSFKSCLLETDQVMDLDTNLNYKIQKLYLTGSGDKSQWAANIPRMTNLAKAIKGIKLDANLNEVAVAQCGKTAAEVKAVFDTDSASNINVTESNVEELAA